MSNGFVEDTLEQKVGMVLQALMMGIRIRDKDGVIYLFDGHYRLCVLGHNQNDEERLLVMNLGEGVYLKDFIGFVREKFDAYEIDAIRLNIGLNSI